MSQTATKLLAIIASIDAINEVAAWRSFTVTEINSVCAAARADLAAPGALARTAYTEAHDAATHTIPPNWRPATRGDDPPNAYGGWDHDGHPDNENPQPEKDDAN